MDTAFNPTRAIQLHDEDNVAVALDKLAPGDIEMGVTIRDRVPRGHKFTLTSVPEGEPVRKYGQIIGFAAAPIEAGHFAHEHNVVMKDFGRDYRFTEAVKPIDPLPDAELATFEGYRRPGGRTGTRNYIGIVTSVNCSASVARIAAEEAARLGLADDYPEIDGFVAITHGTGCGMADSGEGFEVLGRTLRGYLAHPNFGSVLMVGLGCEVFQIARMKKEHGLGESDTFRSMMIQGIGGTRKTVEAILDQLREMVPIVGAARRETRPASELILAMQCGGSDGYSGLTANPALGVASDLLVRHGGTSILSETPEIYGAEHLLTARAVSREVGEKLVERIRWWEAYVARAGGEMNNNPSPGNKLGGLTTILEKSLGAVAKGGNANLSAVYEYAEPVTTRGFVFMDTPGFDPVSATGQIAGGANVVAFTTGRGSAFGAKPAPSLKLATNSELYRHMDEDMDIDCGEILQGKTLEDKGREIFETILRVASGERTKSECLGYGNYEFVPWQIGAVM
ncbi:altronate dehydratase family protein [Fulvimarina sp. MAC8]|uniref:UxaA family hydrolase n=1 Tax=Fulvimarina sp. MAC8 TaxID=3162874 RepID=UPI0032ECD52D